MTRTREHEWIYDTLARSLSPTMVLTRPSVTDCRRVSGVWDAAETAD